MTASPLLDEFLPELRAAAATAPLLDLACGSGRNGLWLVSRGIPVVFADIRRDALEQVQAALPPGREGLATLWQVDLERPGGQPLEAEGFGAVLVFRYLHRPLMPAIANAVQPGGLVVYETFTTGQPAFGRPTNPDFLLRPGELPGYFRDWEILRQFEGEVTSAATGVTQAIARLVARKPPP